MKSNSHVRSRPRLARGVLLVASSLAALSSCVSQEQYAEEQLNSKHYQSKKIELEARVSELEDENRRLRGQLEASDASLKEAGFDSGAIDERLRNLQSILSDIGGEPGDVTKFAVEGGYVYRMKDSILFGLGSADISADGRKVLAEVAKDINSRAHGRVYVRGHTDSTPIVKPETLKRFPRGNLELSAARALEVASVLTKDGNVEGGRVVVMGFGPNEPVATNDNDANKQLNRRVEVFVADSEAGTSSANAAPPAKQ